MICLIPIVNALRGTSEMSSMHPQSYAYFMRKNLFDGLDINPENTNIENGMAEDEAKECARYDALLEQLPRDIQLLGLGSNGHIAFNEPHTLFGSGTHIVTVLGSPLYSSRLTVRTWA